ncbi:MAG: sugar ABC transporter permease [Clostridiales bacterium]|nr:sugar ABC transporter permease [Clostridiales bacterium]
MLNYANFSQLMYNTLYISVLKLIFGMFSTLLLALLFNELRNMKFKRAVQSLSYLPHFVSWVILGGIIRELFSPTRGVVNEIIKFFGGKPIYFLADPHYFVFLLIITYLWQSVGWGTIIYLAAISSIDQEQYESAVIDGASRFQRARYITIPGIMPTVVTLLVLNLGGILNAGFDQIFNLYTEQVYSVADILDTYVYRVGLIKFDYSYSAAIGLFKNAIGIVLVILSNLTIKRMTKGEYKIW